MCEAVRWVCLGLGRGGLEQSEASCPGLSLSKQPLHSSTELPRDPALALALQRGVWEPSLLGTEFVAVLPWGVQGLGRGREGKTPCLFPVPCLTRSMRSGVRVSGDAGLGSAPFPLPCMLVTGHVQGHGPRTGVARERRWASSAGDHPPHVPGLLCEVRAGVRCPRLRRRGSLLSFPSD